MSASNFKLCVRCNEEKPLSEFHFVNKERGIYKNYCKSCDNLMRTERRRKRNIEDTDTGTNVLDNKENKPRKIKTALYLEKDVYKMIQEFKVDKKIDTGQSTSISEIVNKAIRKFFKPENE